jgi:hypothetical protein
MRREAGSRRWLEFLTGSSVQRASERRFATVVFTDIVGSTVATIDTGDDGWRAMLDRHDQIAFEVCDQDGGEIVKSTGDGLLARFDLPNAGVSFARDFHRRISEIGLSIRAGIHSGEIEVRENRDIAGVAAPRAQGFPGFVAPVRVGTLTGRLDANAYADIWHDSADNEGDRTFDMKKKVEPMLYLMELMDSLSIWVWRSSPNGSNLSTLATLAWATSPLHFMT